MNKRGVSLLLLMGCFFLLSPLPVQAEKTPPLVFSFFKSFISGTDGKRCDHVPSCARYAKDAVEAYGPIEGFVLACDRLMRCGGDDMRIFPKVMIGGELYVLDPASENGFWWHQKTKTLKDPRRSPDFLTFENW